VEAVFLAALHAEPNDEPTWLALADWLDEDGQADRAELVRLVRRLRPLPVMEVTPERAEMEDRVAELLNAGVRPVVPEVVNSIGMRLALIPPGRFRLGSPSGENERGGDEEAHEVELMRPFYLGVVPVTQGQWLLVRGTNPSYFCATGEGKEEVEGMDTSDFPVETVSWEDAQAFLEKLAALPEEKEKGWKYRLPSEAEWEYSCRGGASSSPFCFGASLSSTQANFNGEYPYGGAEKGPYLGRTCPAASYRPNAFGLFDLHGNVWEWCEDWYAEDYDGKSPAQDPTGPPDGSYRVVRGGSWSSLGSGCRAAVRGGGTPSDRNFALGFRVAAPGGLRRRGRRVRGPLRHGDVQPHGRVGAARAHRRDSQGQGRRNCPQPPRPGQDRSPRRRQGFANLKQADAVTKQLEITTQGLTKSVSGVQSSLSSLGGTALAAAGALSFRKARAAELPLGGGGARLTRLAGRGGEVLARGPAGGLRRGRHGVLLRHGERPAGQEADGVHRLREGS
jgi:uncharacterized protein (TIGR02996 family)